MRHGLPYQYLPIHTLFSYYYFIYPTHSTDNTDTGKKKPIYDAGFCSQA